MPRRTIRPIAPVDPRRVVPSLGSGRSDPSFAVDEAAWICCRIGSEPATLRFEQDGPQIVVEAWGPGAAAGLEAAPGIVGAADDPSELVTDDPVVDRLHRLVPWVRITRSELVFDAALRAVFGQKVTGKEAKRSYRRMVENLGDAAPGPRSDLVLPPEPRAVAALGYEDFHPWGVERKRAETVLEVARRARRMQGVVTMPLPDAYRRLQAIRGIGPWTAALIGMQALGDADAVPVGDFHIPNTVAWVMAGEPRGDDDRMLELLEPFRPQRGRVVRLIKSAGARAPKYGPRVELRNIERI